MEGIAILVFIVVIYVLCHIEEWKFDNRITPPDKETDWSAMSSDLARGMSKQEVMRKSNREGYDVPKKHTD